MNRRIFVLSAFAALTISNCAPKPKPVDLIVIEKSKRKMTLFRGDEPFKTYDVGLGFAPVGHKYFEGDGKTPEGRYYIWTKNPRSAFHLSLGISYPTEADAQVARSRGLSPGGDIFIHGESSNPLDMLKRDWTAGCIAVTNEEIREIYSVVGVGAIVDIRP